MVIYNELFLKMLQVQVTLFMEISRHEWVSPEINPLGVNRLNIGYSNNFRAKNSFFLSLHQKINLFFKNVKKLVQNIDVVVTF